MRAPDGAIESFDVAGAGTDPYQGVYVRSISDAGVVAGYVVGGNYEQHGFTRSADGDVSVIEIPNALRTDVQAVDDRGNTIGTWFGPHARHGFVLKPDGTVKSYELPGEIFAASSKGAVAGYFSDGAVNHGFVRTH